MTVVISRIVLFLLIFFSLASARADFTGKVIAVIDGDTIEVLNEKTPVRIRLHGIDCPEKGQAFGKRAKQAASTLAFGKEVTVQAQGKGKYGRTIGDVTLPEGLNLNHELVKQGWCWWYRQYAPTDAKLSALEDEARTEKRGLWQDSHPIPPWEWRKSRARASSSP